MGCRVQSGEGGCRVQSGEGGGGFIVQSGEEGVL